MRLYHFTCGHAAPMIRQAGVIRPHEQPALSGIKLIWLTDMEWPDRLALGLTSITLNCDRTEWRVTVDADAQRWVDAARGLPGRMRWGLEFAPGAMPMHWYVSDHSLPVLTVEQVAS